MVFMNVYWLNIHIEEGEFKIKRSFQDSKWFYIIKNDHSFENSAEKKWHQGKGMLLLCVFSYIYKWLTLMSTWSNTSVEHFRYKLYWRFYFQADNTN